MKLKWMDQFNKLFKRKKSPVRKVKIRTVYFGISLRLLGILILAMFFIISALTIIMYSNQIKLLNDEKREKAGALAQILSGPSEFYMDSSSKTTPKELEVKYKLIVDEVANFKKYNEGITKIFLTDEKGRIVYSTYAAELNDMVKSAYLTNCLAEKTEKLDFYDYKLKGKDKKFHKYRAITFPIFLHNGNVIETLKDFSQYFQKYHDSNKGTKSEIYAALYDKYKAGLGPEFDLNPKQAHKKSAKPRNPALLPRVMKAGDVDFLFLKLFSDIMAERNKRVKPGEAWLWKDEWLTDQKLRKYKAYENDNTTEAKKADDFIIGKMNDIFSQVDQIRKLGALAMVFDVDKINREFSQNINTAIQVALSILLLSAVVFLIVIQLMIKNLKKLEKWAITIGEGNIDTKLEIKSSDEIGRIADVFNLMLIGLKAKFHMEKYVSNSTRSMLEKAGEENACVELGKSERKTLAFIFSDVRGFTSFSEKNDPELVLEVLNLYLELQSKIIRARKGDIDDYVGDQIMAHFGGRNRADAALETAVEMIRAINQLNDGRKKQGLPYFEVGIGVHGGDVVVGNIGSGFRMDYTCLGDTVNTSARLCSNAKAGEILVSEELFNLCRKTYLTEKIAPLSVKGKAEAIAVVKVLPS